VVFRVGAKRARRGIRELRALFLGGFIQGREAEVRSTKKNVAFFFIVRRPPYQPPVFFAILLPPVSEVFSSIPGLDLRTRSVCPVFPIFLLRLGILTFRLTLSFLFCARVWSCTTQSYVSRLAFRLEPPPIGGHFLFCHLAFFSPFTSSPE
jgi:hypothetical protein